jgi:hypothetical protein
VERVPIAPGIHGHEGWSSRRAENLLGKPVELAEGVSAHQHVGSPPWSSDMVSVILMATTNNLWR